MSAQLSGLILAGGEGRRMGGVDKGWVEYQGRPLIEQVLDRLAPQVSQVLISANRNRERYGALGVAVLADRQNGFCGPLAGIESGLHAAAPGWLLCVPCDSPDLPPNLAQKLAQATANGAAAAVVSLHGRMQPVFCLLQTALAARLSADLEKGERRVGAWLESIGARPVDFTDQAGAFKNLNSPDTLAG
ncbi:molybdenum cofactor guanylyltransferase [Niveibacterium sp. 24ML]|uniref:molybdenum cofactor guanylyltransferase MobA n=1 Tax=Niveibacterium sp. 24ML TaxID=2985512 RepID=UPI00226F7E92|nr:molybdenum cofactor guanylyltransferase MobA [Niveibacterium sp. 24ML]MCX9155318.1 molybdenum cofactor guanylyltransferase [Niveibacterium sp. 24ML]